MTFYAILDGQDVLRVVEQTSPPSGSYATLTSWSGVPGGGMPGKKLRVTNGVAGWVDVDSAAAWVHVRQARDRLLAASDWTVTRAVERQAQIPTAWSDYRQALRDITEQADPFNITWPTPPAE